MLEVPGRGRIVDVRPVEAGGGTRHVGEGDFTGRKGKAVRLERHKTTSALEVNRERGRCLCGIGADGVLRPVASARPHRRSFLIKRVGRGLHSASRTDPGPVMKCNHQRALEAAAGVLAPSSSSSFSLPSSTPRRSLLIA